MSRKYRVEEKHVYHHVRIGGIEAMGVGFILGVVFLSALRIWF
jgi:hypothetical protein